MQYDEQQRIQGDPGGETAQALFDAQGELTKLLSWLKLAP